MPNTDILLERTHMKQLNEFHCHELLDRTYIIASMLDEFVLEVLEEAEEPVLLLLADQASRTLGDLYQALGQHCMSKGRDDD